MAEKVKFIYTPFVIDFLDDLVRILYKKEYFGFIDTAENYVLKIYDAIEKDVCITKHQETPAELSYLGSSYIFYKSNKRTTWYVFFERKENNYLITGILNNYCEEVKYLIK